MNSEDDHDCRGLAVALINDLAPKLRRIEITRWLRRILAPLAAHYPIVHELRRLLELGEAVALRVPAGADQGKAVGTPAIIEFQEVGTLCFYRPLPVDRLPPDWQTIRIKHAPRARIMALAEVLADMNAADRRARERQLAKARKRRAARREDDGGEGWSCVVKQQPARGSAAQ
jgi:hypothetical protein